MIAAPAHQLTIRCEKGRKVGSIETLPDGRPLLTVARLAVPSVEPVGYFDQSRLDAESGGADAAEPAVSIVLDGDSAFSKATFYGACGCHERVHIRPTRLATEFASKARVVKLPHGR